MLYAVFHIPNMTFFILICWFWNVSGFFMVPSLENTVGIMSLCDFSSESTTRQLARATTTVHKV
jgi:hypothetical protein